MTLEEAQQEILTLKETVQVKDNEIANKDTEIENLKKDNTRIREINQQYYLKLSAQYTPGGQDPKKTPGQDGKDDDIPSCEKFAETLKF